MVGVKGDDQGCAQKLYVNSAKTSADVKLTIDFHSKLFQSAWGSELEKWNYGDSRHAEFARIDRKGWFDQDGRLRNPETGSYPATLHFNGAKDFMPQTTKKVIGPITAQVLDRTIKMWENEMKLGELCSGYM